MTNEGIMQVLLSSHGIKGDAAECVKLLCEGKKQVRTYTGYGFGRFRSGLDVHERTKEALEKLGLHYLSGNDAPRGGLNGNWITLTADALKKLNK